MELELRRTELGTNYSIGELKINSVYFCDTLEDAVRENKIPGETAIPRGTYKIDFYKSNHYKSYMPYLIDVPNFNGIMIHIGNTVEDTRGCILVGKHYSGNTISDSTVIFKELYDLLFKAKSDGITITII
jgi:hypothetical protein